MIVSGGNGWVFLSPKIRFRRCACAHAVQLAEHIDNEDIKYVAGAILPLRTGTRMKLLRHLLIDPKTTYLVGDVQAHFRNTFNGGLHQVKINSDCKYLEVPPGTVSY